MERKDVSYWHACMIQFYSRDENYDDDRKYVPIRWKNHKEMQCVKDLEKTGVKYKFLWVDKFNQTIVLEKISS